MYPWELQGHGTEKGGGNLWNVGHDQAAVGDVTMMMLVTVGCFPGGLRMSTELETPSTVTAKGGDLSPNGSCFVIQHMSHLANTNFLSDTPWKTWISFDLGSLPGMSC